MNVARKANDKALEKLGFKSGKVTSDRTRVKKVQEVIGNPGSSGVALKRAVNRCKQAMSADCTITGLKLARKKRKEQEHVNRINKHYAAKSERMGKANKPKVRRVVTDVTRRRK